MFKGMQCMKQYLKEFTVAKFNICVLICDEIICMKTHKYNDKIV